MASQIKGYIGKIQLEPGTNKTQYSLGSTAYGYCQTAADTADKQVEMTGFTLTTGATIFVKFQYENTADSPTLNVNNTGSKSICQYGTTAAGTTNKTTGWPAGALLSLTYDGSRWIRSYFYNTTYSNATTTAAGLLSAADKIKLDGIDAEANKYTLPLATSSTRGGVKIGYTTSNDNRNYGVLLSSEKMYVNVPWTDTKVDTVDHHYKPLLTDNSTLSASASGGTANWSIDVVTGVSITKDAAGHITGVSVSSGKIPANPGHYNAYLYTAANSSTKAQTTEVLTDPWLNLVENNTVQSYIHLVGQGDTTISTSASGHTIYIKSTDKKTLQSADTTASWRKILLHYTADSTYNANVTETTNQVYASKLIAIQPSTGSIKTAGSFLGVKSGAYTADWTNAILRNESQAGGGPGSSSNQYRPIIGAYAGTAVTSGEATYWSHWTVGTLSNTENFYFRYTPAQGNVFNVTLPAPTAASTIAYTSYVDNEIGKLDVSSAGDVDGSKYIAAISETNGKISATAINVATTYSATGTTAISGKGVAAALATLNSTLPTGSASKTLTALSIVDGKISSATFTDIAIGAGQISGQLSVSHGGTGASSFTTNSIVISNNSTTGALTTLASGTSGQYLKSNGNNNTPTWTNFSKPVVNWTNGTTAGPTLSITTDGGTSAAVAIPSASDSISGIVTTGNQTFAGRKTIKLIKPIIYDGTSNTSRYHHLYFHNNADTELSRIVYDSGNATNVTSGKFYFEQFSPNSTATTKTTGFYESYSLPTVTTGLETDKFYSILTSKDAVEYPKYANEEGSTYYIKTNLIAQESNQMLYGYIQGNGYTDSPIHVDFQTYYYTAHETDDTSVFVNSKYYDATNAISSMQVLRDNNNIIYFKLVRKHRYTTYKIFIYGSGESNAKNHVVSISQTAPSGIKTADTVDLIKVNSAIEAGTTNRIAYYSADHTISAAQNHVYSTNKYTLQNSTGGADIGFTTTGLNHSIHFMIGSGNHNRGIFDSATYGKATSYDKNTTYYTRSGSEGSYTYTAATGVTSSNVTNYYVRGVGSWVAYWDEHNYGHFGPKIGINGINTNYTFYVNGTASIAGITTLNDNLDIITKDTDKFINFYYNTSKTHAASWRLGYLGSGSGNANYFVLQSGNSNSNDSTRWNSALQIGMNNHDIITDGTTFTFDNTAQKIQGKDSTNTIYGLIAYNGTNLWVGANGSDSIHHAGATYISTGWAGTNPANGAAAKGSTNTTIYVSVPKKQISADGKTTTWSHTSYPVLHTGNGWSLTGGTIINNTSTLLTAYNDFNKITTIGNYYCTYSSAVSSGQMAHSPFSSMSAFTLKVEHSTGNSDTYLRQTIRLYNSGNEAERTSPDAGATWSDWRIKLNSSNYTTYTVKKDGTGATGTWGINITGNAMTATTLKTARTINGTSFDGSANITTANWGTSRNITIKDADSTNAGSAVSVNGSAAITLLLPSTIKASLTGNATTATTASKVMQTNVTNTTDTYRAVLLSGDCWDGCEPGATKTTTNTNKIYYDAPTGSGGYAMGLGFNPKDNILQVKGTIISNTATVNKNTIEVQYNGNTYGKLFVRTAQSGRLYLGNTTSIDSDGGASGTLILYGETDKYLSITPGAITQDITIGATTSASGITTLTVNKGLTISSGNLTLSSGIINQSSDKNVKHNIQSISNKYEQFYNNLQPKQFKYNYDETNRNRFGFIAQEVEEAYKKAELDYQDDAIIAKRDNNEQGEWDLNMMDIVPLNTWQIQQMKQEIEMLKAEITELRKLVKNNG